MTYGKKILTFPIQEKANMDRSLSMAHLCLNFNTIRIQEPRKRMLSTHLTPDFADEHFYS